jgi:predicted DNA-binding protein
MTERTLNVRIPVDLLRRIEAFAEKQGTSLMAVVNEALEEYLETMPPAALQRPDAVDQEEQTGQAQADRLFERIDREREAILSRRGGALLDDPVAMLDRVREESDVKEPGDIPHPGD